MKKPEDKGGRDGLRGPMTFVYVIIVVGAAILIGTFFLAGRAPQGATEPAPQVDQ
ncbi:hypothetical protein [Falsirhodobacter xinxiangensis]|uniref:hypothetical protein n=1 Tax=Falsirhodobacter xinxiangensis TaxID=2530049 RepID=UPI00145BF05B|nr:hypothetical protein [Rhodobacter xinxiangensis]